MHGRPCHPGQKATETQAAALQHGEALSDHRHGALIEVAEGTEFRFPADASVNQRSRVASLLYGHLGYSGQRMAVLIERCRVTDHEDLLMARHAEILPDT